MRAIQIVNLDGPDRALAVAEISEPEASQMLTPGSGVVVEVRAAGVSFPELLQTRGEYQIKPPLPFVPGSEVGGVVRSAPDGAAVGPGDRVAAFCMLGGFAEVAIAPAHFCFALSEELGFDQGAALVLNYHTAYFALKLRGRLLAGETVLVHGAAGGVRNGFTAGRSRSRGQDDRGRLERGEGARRARGGSRSRGALGRPLEGPGP